MASKIDPLRVRRWRDELDERNEDNVTRTQSYLELYEATVHNPPDLPWVLMAHLVSRNAGYLMSDIARSLRSGTSTFREEALVELFFFLERANYLIFWDAWWHVTTSLLEGSEAMGGRTTQFVRNAWARYERASATSQRVAPDVERALVLDLVENEQNYIERRVVHHGAFPAARAIVGFAEAAGAEKPVVLPVPEVRVKVNGFARLERRIAAGRQIFDEALADPERRRAAFEWALRTPHTGSREAHGGRVSPAVKEAWSASTVRRLAPWIHDPPQEDPAWP